MAANKQIAKVGEAALRMLSEEEILADPAGAMKLAQDAMRAAVQQLTTLRKERPR